MMNSMLYSIVPFFPLLSQQKSNLQLYYKSTDCSNKFGFLPLYQQTHHLLGVLGASKECVSVTGASDSTASFFIYSSNASAPY